MKDSKVILLIDGNNLLYRTYFSSKRLSYKGQDVSILHKLPQSLRHLQREFKPEKIFIIWDGKKSKHRLALHPEYKAKRKKLSIDLESIFFQRDHLVKMLDALGIPQAFDIDMEGDDMLYLVLRKLKKLKEHHNFIIVSTDKDFYQLIDSRTGIYSPKNDKFYNAKAFEDEFYFPVTQFLDYLILVGDSSDNIPGYPGIGPVYAVQFLAQFGSIKNFLRGSESFKKVDKKLLHHIYQKNILMMGLAQYYRKYLKSSSKIKFISSPNPKPRIKEYKKLCQQYYLKLNSSADFIEAMTGRLH